MRQRPVVTVPLGAFTLIELLLAVTIFAIVLAAINTVFFAALRLRDRTSAAVDEQLPLDQALSVLRRDLQGALPPGGVLAGDFRTGGSSTAMGLATAPGGLDFFSCSGVINDDQPWGDVVEVNYQLATSTDPATAGAKDLLRSVNRNLLATTTPEIETRRLLANVQTVEFLFFDGTQWRDTWDTSLGDPGLPLAVSVRIQLAAGTNQGGGPGPAPLQLLVALETQSLTNQTQTNSLTSGGLP